MRLITISDPPPVDLILSLSKDEVVAQSYSIKSGRRAFVSAKLSARRHFSIFP
jgi:hypothetical protein